LAYAKQYGLACEVSEPHRRSVTPKPYAENFPAVLKAAVWPELLLAAGAAPATACISRLGSIGHGETIPTLYFAFEE
jgi:hypothetical protein